MKVSLIVAIGKQGQIGKDNKLLWHISEDLKNFKKLTTNHPIIMGRKTFESIGKPLPQRTNIVISSQTIANVITVSNLEAAIESAKIHDQEEAFIIGGAQVYKTSLDQKFVDRIYLSRVNYDGDADTFFHFDSSQFRCTHQEDFADFQFEIWERI
jgi:dihydrofolate reductase